MDCYCIKDYGRRYAPTNKAGGVFKNTPPYVQLPVKPQGKGVRRLLRNLKQGGRSTQGSLIKNMSYFGVWCLLLEDATANTPHLRGWLLNHNDQPATIEEIADSVNMTGAESFVKSAIDCLCGEMGWLERVPWPHEKGVCSEQVVTNLEQGATNTQVSCRSKKNPGNKVGRNKTKQEQNKTKLKLNKQNKNPLIFGDSLALSLSKKEKNKTAPSGGVSKERGWLALVDLLKQIFTGQDWSNATHTTIRSHVFEPHWAAVGGKGFMRRLVALGDLAKSGANKKNPIGYFVSEQKRRWPSEPKKEYLTANER